MNVIQVPVENIRIRRRIRKEMGDITALAESLRRHGLICPVVIGRDNVLIAGHRRLLAARMLGWSTINAVIHESPSKLARLELEFEENVQRNDFTMEEIAEATKRIYRLQNPSLLSRIIAAIARFFRRLFGRD